jgi:hypothetical protein
VPDQCQTYPIPYQGVGREIMIGAASPAEGAAQQSTPIPLVSPAAAATHVQQAHGSATPQLLAGTQGSTCTATPRLMLSSSSAVAPVSALSSSHYDCRVPSLQSCPRSKHKGRWACFAAHELPGLLPGYAAAPVEGFGEGLGETACSRRPLGRD